ncbi:MAG: redox-sensing transcriptional repressor Rex [Acidobacteria bacterium]|nr:redox-sensing transcriptional repressor Rex [Acidobacteriota bacterium]
MNSAQIRKDLAYFGDFGIRGVGYNIDELREQLTKILGLDRPHALAIIGAGRLGTALADYYRFAQSNFAVAALFDSDPAKIGERIGEVSVFDIKNFPEISEEFNIDVAVIAVPAEFAQTVLQQITVSGIKAIMNFAPVPLQVPENVKLKTVDLTISLESLSYFLAQPISNGKKN